MRVRLAIALGLLGPPDATADVAAWPEPPFEAEVALASVNARASPDPSAPQVGLLEEGNRVQVTSCVPACDRDGWAVLGGDGAVRLRFLRPAAGPPRAPERFVHGTVRGGDAPVHARPYAGSDVLHEEPEGRVLAFPPDADARGWLRRPHGGYVAGEKVRMERPSAFAGERSPALPLAFFVREAELDPEEAGGEAGWRVPRYARLPARAADAEGRVLVDGGWVAREGVRIALWRSRPEGVPPGARWVHVDLGEQVLTAYDGDDPVFATLVSSGAPGCGTPAGLHRIEAKVRHGDMLSERWSYHLEEVPHVLYFHGNCALHGTFWHDRFGKPVSHGCVNLSLADAAWLFEWAPPRLPAGWHTVMPPPGSETLRVFVERAP